MDNWKIKLNDNPLYPALIIDNWYNAEEEQEIWDELYFFRSSIPIQRTENLNEAAKDNDNNSLAFVNRWFPIEVYNRKEESASVRLVDKVRSDEFHSIITPLQPFSRMFINSQIDRTIISYYGEGDYYKEHIDLALWTQLTWFVEDREMFEGGDLKLNDTGEIVELRHNRTLFMPSCLLHEVLPIKKLRNKDMGRWTITHFYMYMVY